jgi:hypothetical protein
VFVYLAFALLGVGALLLTLGLFYRAGAIITCAGMAYWFLLDKSVYLNHRYLVVLFAFLLIFIPAHAAYSVDGRRRPRSPSETVPGWSLWLLRFQVAAPYFFAGIAKLDFDWLVRAEPLGSALLRQMDTPLVGRFFALDGTARVLAWGSAFFDCTVAFFLLYRRTRVLAFAAALAFHVLNSRLFAIGIFPWLMIVATMLFFDADWPRRMGRSLRSGGTVVRAAVLVGFGTGFALGGFFPGGFAAVRALTGGVGVGVLTYHLIPGRLRARMGAGAAVSSFGFGRAFVLRRPMAAFLAVWVTVQVLVPLRHWVIPGDVNWTEEGDRFAWRLLLNEKQARAAFVVTEPATGKRWVEDQRKHLTGLQIRNSPRPDLLLQFAHYLKDYYREQGRDVEVRVEAAATLNGRSAQWWILPKKDLTTVSRPYIGHADWIEPLERYDA